MESASLQARKEACMADLFTVTAPLAIRFANGEKQNITERLGYHDGLLFLPTFWTETGIDKALRFVAGPIKGDGPWKVGDAVVTVLACHGTDAELVNDFSCWQTHLLQMGEAYPARDKIEKMMKTRAAAVANINSCHPLFRKAPG
jgi:hypothetical protein